MTPASFAVGRKTRLTRVLALTLVLNGLASASILPAWAQIEYGFPSEKQSEEDLYKGAKAGDSGTGSGAGSGSGAFTLSGGVTHSDALEPLPVDERAGAVVPAQTKQSAQTRQTKQIPQSKPNSTVPARNRPVGQPRQGQSAHTGVATTTSTKPFQYKLPDGAAQTSGNSRLGVGQIDYSLQGLDQARRNAALKAGNGTMDSAQFAYKQRMQAAVQETLAPPLRAGTQAQVRQQLKVRVPHWLSGSWLRTDSTETSRSELPSGKKLKPVGKQSARVVDVFGTYKDKKGQVWMVMPLGNTGMVDRGVALDCHKVKKYSIVETGKTSCLIKVQASHFVVDKRTGRVLSAYQDEELNSYRLVGSGLVRTDSSVKVFDEMGAAKLLTRAFSTQKRIKTL